MLDCLAHVALAALTAASWVGAGALVLSPLPRSGDAALDLLNRFGAGAIVFTLLTFAAGWLGLLYDAAYLPALIVAAAYGGLELSRAARAARRPRPRSWPRWQAALLALIAGYAVVALLVTCAPISSADALFYHAALPEQFAREHRLEEVPWAWGSYQPFAVQMLVLDGFLLWDSTQGAFAPLLLLFGASAVVFVATARLRGRGVGLLATAIFAAQPFALWLGTSTFVEPGGALMAALAVANLLRVGAVPRVEPLLLAGAFTGGAAATKYVGAIAAAVLGATALVALRRRLRPRHLGAFVLAAAFVALPWYVKNAIVVGDPVYPYLRGWSNEEARLEAEATFGSFGYGRSPIDLALLPFRLLGAAEPFNRAEYISPLFLLFAPLALLSRGVRPLARTLLAGCGLFVVLWFFTVQDSRYLLFVLPVLAPLAAVGIVELLSGGRVGRIVAVGGAISAFLVGGVVSAAYASQFAAFVAGVESEDEFLRENVSYHDGTEWLNEHLPPASKVLLGHVMLLHLDREGLVWTADALPASAGPEQTRAFFRRNGITHAAVLGSGEPRQLRWVGGRRIARVPVRPVTSRTRSSFGPPDVLTVYEVR